MSKHNPRPVPADPQLDKAIAALIKNTRTTRRHLSLPEIAEWLEVAVAGYGSVREVADRIGLSSKMLRQFLTIRQLAPAVQDLFATRRLDSVDMAVHLRMLLPEEQTFVATEASRGDLSTGDVRAVSQYRKEHSDTQIEDIVKKVKATRNIKQYVVEFVVRGRNPGNRALLGRFGDVLGKGSIVSLALDGSIGKLVLNQKGRSLLRGVAKANGLTQAEAIDKIARGEL